MSELEIAKTQVAKSEKTRPEERPAPASETERKARRDFFEAGVSLDEARDRLLLDAKNGAVILMPGSGDPRLARQIGKEFVGRIKALGVDEQPIAAASIEELVTPRANAAGAALLGPFADLEARTIIRARLNPDVQEVPPLVVAKIIDDEVSAESVYLAPLDGGTQPKISTEAFREVQALERTVFNLARTTAGDAELAARLREMRDDKTYCGLSAPERLVLTNILKTASFGPESSKAVDALVDPELLVGEEIAVQEFSDLLANAPEDARDNIYRGIRFDRNFQELSDEGKFTLYLRLKREGLAPTDSEAARALLKRKKMVAATSAGKDVALFVIRGSRDDIENLTEDIRTSDRVEVTASLDEGDVVVMIPTKDADAAADILMRLRGNPVAEISRRLAEAGSKTNVVLEAK